MLSPFATILVAGVFIITLALIAVAPRGRRAAWADVALGAMLGAFIGGRIMHILLQYEYFAVNTDEVWRIGGDGTNWHGALLGAWWVAFAIARFRRVHFVRWLDTVALFLPALALIGWLSCWVGLCAYGKVIPLDATVAPYLVHDAMDVYGVLDLRYATQPLGVLLCLPVIGLAGVLWHKSWAQGYRWGLILVWLGGLMFLLGFLRGDTMPLATLQTVTLRADQWLDVLMIIVGLTLLLRPMSITPSLPSSPIP